MQAFLAAKAGADYAAPYGNRIDNLGADGVRTAETIQGIFTANGLKAQIPAASFQNSRQVQDLCEYGIGAATLAPDIFEKLISRTSAASAVETFISDFEALCGPGKTMQNCDDWFPFSCSQYLDFTPGSWQNGTIHTKGGVYPCPFSRKPSACA